MSKINNHSVQNKRTGEKFAPEKSIGQCLIRIAQGGNLPGKNNRTCTIIQYPRVRSHSAECLSPVISSFQWF